MKSSAAFGSHTCNHSSIFKLQIRSVINNTFFVICPEALGLHRCIYKGCISKVTDKTSKNNFATEVAGKLEIFTMSLSGPNFAFQRHTRSTAKHGSI